MKKAWKFSAKDRFGSKTQKLSSRDRDSDSRESDKEDFDGRSSLGLPSEDNVTAPPIFPLRETGTFLSQGNVLQTHEDR